MNYFLFKLRFDTAVHFGSSDSALSLYTSEETLPADTLFSALCHEALAQQGEPGLEQLCAAVQQGRLLFSDTMPWRGSTFYLPKPIAASGSTAEVPTVLRKKIKKLAWLPVLEFDWYARSLHAAPYIPQDLPEYFGVHYEQTRAEVPAQGDTRPYQVGAFRFAEDCGLYFVCACAEKAQAALLERLLRGLGLTGIGGKVSAGCGKFHLEQVRSMDAPADAQDQWMRRALQAQHGPYLLLTTSLPQADELDAALEGDCSFQLVRRGGFMASDRVTTPLKKKTQYYLAAGSVLQHTYQGALYDVGLTDAHPVYRYSKPLFMGVEL